VIRATFVSVVDQALLSGLNFALAFALIHFGTKEDYGLYAQLINLQSFFSPLHAGVFVSAHLAIASKLQGTRLINFRTSIARAEVAVGAASAVIVIGICSIGGKFFGSTLTPATCAAFGIALLGLWWREFIRTTQFTELKFHRALQVDATYCLSTAAGAAVAAVVFPLAVSSIFWCMAFGALVATAGPLYSALRASAVDAPAIKRDLLLSWNMGRWDVLGSVVSWGYQQSYVYFAALHGGLVAAAEISAARLLVTPLALMWASYANVLRPKASQLFAAGSYTEIRRLAMRSSAFVVCATALFGIGALAAMPFFERYLFSNKFHHLRLLTLCWLVYICLTGLGTVMSSVLRSALEFQQIFHRQVISCIAAMVLLGLGARYGGIESIVIALTIVEAISVVLLWERLHRALSPRTDGEKAYI
jgi:O-antigen/teichoic acid export membrane protein